MSDQMIQRAILLLQQRKYKEAENILNSLFAQDPNDVNVISIICEVKIQQNKYTEALNLVNTAIGLNPGLSHLFYVRARIYVHEDKYDQAEKDLQQAITLDPDDADYFALYALLKLDRKQFDAALQLADAALERDPENINALNARSTALLKLNRKEESFSSIEGSLRQDPHNAYTHANYGWGLLEKGSPKEALYHFTEALRIDPSLQLAQSGMIEALKAKYFLYRVFLKYAFWMGNLTAKYQWGVIIGIFIASRALRFIAASYPAFEPFLYPVIILIAIFAFSTWIITPLSNLFLRLNKYGKHLLDRDEIISSNFVGVSAVAAIAGGALYLATGQEHMLAIVIVGISMMVPLSSMFNSVKNRTLLVIYTSVLAVLGIAGIITGFLSKELVNGFTLAYLVGVMLFSWLANYLVIKEQNR